MPTRFLHDCRRTAARNLIRANVPERVAMLLTGHKSRAIFDRYNIIHEQELLDAGDQLVAYLGAAGAGGTSPPAAPPGRTCRPAYRITPPPRTTRHRVRAHAPPAPARGRGGSGRTPPACAARFTHGLQARTGPRSWHTRRRAGQRPRIRARPGPSDHCQVHIVRPDQPASHGRRVRCAGRPSGDRALPSLAGR